MRLTVLATFLAGALGVAIVAGCASGATPNAPGEAPQRPSQRVMQQPTPTPTPIQLVIGGVIGTPTFPEGDTATGGQGQQVDTVNCRSFLNNVYHHHVQLSMFVNGTQIALPRGTGMKNPGTNKFVYHADCFYWLHTHDATGIIHVEPPDSRTFTLKQYFDIWGMPLSTNGFAGYTGPVSVYLNQVLQPGMDPTTIVFSPFLQITLVIGNPPSWIPVYLFPPQYK